MDLTIKIIRGVTVSSLIIIGLVACASSPAPWTQKNESPWSAKHAAQAESLPSDDTISDLIDEPLLLDEPEPVAAPDTVAEPVMISEPVPMAPIVVVEALTPEEEVQAMPGSNFAVQVYASKTTATVDRFKSKHNLHDLTMVKTDRSGSIVYILIDIYPDRSTANVAAVDLEASTGSKPWVRSLSGVQKIIAQ